MVASSRVQEVLALGWVSAIAKDWLLQQQSFPRLQQRRLPRQLLPRQRLPRQRLLPQPVRQQRRHHAHVFMPHAAVSVDQEIHHVLQDLYLAVRLAAAPQLLLEPQLHPHPHPHPHCNTKGE